VSEAAFASYRCIARDAALKSVVLAPFLSLALPTDSELRMSLMGR